MAVDLAKVEHLLRRQDTDTALTFNEHDVQSELFHSLRVTMQLLETTPIKSSLNYIIDNELLNEYGVYGPNRKLERHPACGVTYKKGDVVSVNFGSHNIGTELSFSHMGVVVADLDDHIVVVPVTTSRGQFYKDEIKKTILYVPRGVFHKESILLVHQIRSVHKNRIRKDLGFSIKKSATWTELEKKIAHKFAYGVLDAHELQLYKQKKRLKEELKKKYQLEISSKDDQITALSATLASKDVEVVDLKEQLADRERAIMILQAKLAKAEAAIGQGE